MSTNLFKYLREQHALGSVIYYIVAIPTVIFFMAMPQFNDGGPCNPGTNLAVFMLTSLITLILFCVYAFVLMRSGRIYRLPFLLHLGALIVIGLIIFISIMMEQ
jgi:hypothetical protein